MEYGRNDDTNTERKRTEWEKCITYNSIEGASNEKVVVDAAVGKTWTIADWSMSIANQTERGTRTVVLVCSYRCDIMMNHEFVLNDLS